MLLMKAELGLCCNVHAANGFKFISVDDAVECISHMGSVMTEDNSGWCHEEDILPFKLQLPSC